MIAKKNYKRNKFKKGDLVRVKNTYELPSEAIVINKDSQSNQWQVYTINGSHFWFVGTNLELISEANKC